MMIMTVHKLVLLTPTSETSGEQLAKFESCTLCRNKKIETLSLGYIVPSEIIVEIPKNMFD